MDTVSLKIDAEGCFNWCMRADTVGEKLMYLCSAFDVAPAGLLLAFAEGTKTPIFANNAIVGFDKVKEDDIF